MTCQSIALAILGYPDWMISFFILFVAACFGASAMCVYYEFRYRRGIYYLESLGPGRRDNIPRKAASKEWSGYDAHLREQIKDAEARKAIGDGEPGDTDLANYKPAPPTPASTLPLSAATLKRIRADSLERLKAHEGGHPALHSTAAEFCRIEISLCNQALRAIEFAGDYDALAKRCARLTVELEAARKDAERYRWLRSPEAAVAEICNSALDKETGFTFMEGEQLDAAIDAALANQEPQR